MVLPVSKSICVTTINGRWVSEAWSFSPLAHTTFSTFANFRASGPTLNVKVLLCCLTGHEIHSFFSLLRSSRTMLSSLPSSLTVRRTLYSTLSLTRLLLLVVLLLMLLRPTSISLWMILCTIVSEISLMLAAQRCLCCCCNKMILKIAWAENWFIYTVDWLSLC